MKFLKTKKYSILSNIFKYSFIGVFAVTIIFYSLFISGFKNIANAVGEKLTTTDITSSSVLVTFTAPNKNSTTPPYTVYLDDKLNGYTNPTKNQYKTIESSAISSMGVANLNFTGLDPSTEYILSLEHNSTKIIQTNFTTRVKETYGKITNIVPSSAKVGETVTIYGDNLTGVSGITFNGVSAIPSTNNATEIVVKIPEGATTGNVFIRFANFTEISSPTPFTVTPTSGTSTGTGTGTGTGSGTYTGTSTSGKPIVWHGLVPECNTGKIVDGAYENACDFNMVMAIINKVINFLLVTMATPLFALIIIYAGWLYLSDMGSSENITKAKKIIKNALIGYVIALAAWLIVKTILTSLGFTGPMYLS